MKLHSSRPKFLIIRAKYTKIVGLAPIGRSIILEGASLGIRDATLNVPMLDEMRVSEIGRLRSLNLISKDEYEAGVKYGLIMLQYLASIDAPEPYGGDLGNLSEDVCFGRKMAVAAAKTILRDISPRCMRIVDRVTVYDEPTQDDLEMELLRRGLRALAGLPIRPDVYDKPAERETVWDKNLAEIAKRDATETARMKRRYT